MQSVLISLLCASFLTASVLSAQGTAFAGLVQGSAGPALTAPTSSTPPEQRCVVEGRVTNAQTGAPVKRADVRLMRMGKGSVGASGPEGYSGSSDADGAFRFDGIEPGDYYLSGQHSGFLMTNYGASRPRGAGIVLHLQLSQKLSNLNLALISQSIISGRVLDEDGEPVQGVMIQALAETWMNGARQLMTRGGANTNDLGEFRIADLQPGKYYISGQPFRQSMPKEAAASPDKPDMRPVRTFYPDTTTRETAATVTVGTAQVISGIDIHLQKVQTHHVRGKIVGTAPEGGFASLRLNLAVRDEFMPMFFGANPTVNKDGTFDIGGVAPGAYTLSAMSMNRSIKGLARQSIDVGASDLDEVVLTIVPPGAIHGTVVLEGKPPASVEASNLATIGIFFVPRERAFFISNPQVTVKSDGSLTVEDVNPGKYVLHPNNIPEGAYVKSIQFGHQEVFGKELDLTQGVSGELNMFLRYGTAEISGSIQRPQTDPSAATKSNAQPSTSIVLIPDNFGIDSSQMKFSNADQNGTFSLKSLRPGHYRAYAFEELDMQQWQNPDVRKLFESNGVDVELNEGDKKQIQLNVVSLADFQEKLATIGLVN